MDTNIYEIDYSLYDKIKMYPTYDSFIFSSDNDKSILTVDNTAGEWFVEEFSNKTKALIYLMNDDYLPEDVEKEYLKNRTKYKDYDKYVMNKHDYLIKNNIQDRDFLDFKLDEKYEFSINFGNGVRYFKSTIQDALGLAVNYETDLVYNNILLISPLGFDWEENNSLIESYIKTKNTNKNDFGVPYRSPNDSHIEWLKISDIDLNLNLNQNLIDECNRRSMFNAGNSTRERANKIFESFILGFYDKDNILNDNQKKVLDKRAKIFKEFLENSFNEYLNISSHYVSSMVAGPANYPVQKYKKISDRMNTKYQDIMEKISNFRSNTVKMIKEQIPEEEMINKYRHGYNEPISSDDPKAKDKLEAKLEYLQEKHQSYLDFNKKARKENTNQLPSYVLANSNQNMKSIKDRLKLLEKVSSISETGYYFNSGEVRFDKQDNRIRIFFDEIPKDDVRTRLKGNGFKWSPKNQAWQRQLTPQGINKTKQLFKDIGSLEITKTNDYTM